MSTVAPRPLRADARRNREKVLAAAGEAFGEGGLEVQVEDVARRAGVGIGTVYRHFPTKDALVEALAEAHFDWLADVVEAALQRDGDPWQIFVETIWQTAAPAATDASWCEIVAGHPRAADAATAAQARLRSATATLIERAQSAGAMRGDATATDIKTIMCAFGHIASAQGAGTPVDATRYLEIAIDGLRAR